MFKHQMLLLGLISSLVFCLGFDAAAATTSSTTHTATETASANTPANTTAPTNKAAETEQQRNPCYSDSQMESAIDKAHDYLTTKFCQPAIWFDSFFVDDRIEDDAHAATVVRLYNDFAYYEKEGFQYKANLNARLNLPGVTKKLKLILDSTGEDDPFGFIKSLGDDNERDIGLRYDWYAKDRVSFNIKANFKPKVEARWRYTYPISDRTVTRLTQKLYQEKKVTGESTEFDIEHAFSEEFVGRWSAVAQYESRDNGWEFGSSATLYQYINNKQAISYQASIYGVDEPYHYVKKASISATYRQNFARDWLFFAITPEYRWSKEDEFSERINQVVFTFTLEVLFQNV
ncbi:hypothetical protein [Shewanella pneumatophori]|uniref:DUF3078 domain-containing protein n=1 Tax=Shewanella pneumatophori TaxID=314092 RepID=A0A9X1Z946_9GAMM|nr:hypothetical protein [Shewanella pneumatophori]MCL1137904.1 hypothetical protein [Shewanella pneumatophori]